MSRLVAVFAPRAAPGSVSAASVGLALGLSNLRIDASWVGRDLAAAMCGGPGTQLAEADDLVVGLDGFLDSMAPEASRHADAEVLLAAWRRAGPRCLADFDGDFAGVVFDRRQRRITSFRDVVGARPLFLARWNGAFIAATQLAAVMRWPDAELEPSKPWIAGYLNGSPLSPDDAPYGGVRRLLPGHLAEVREGDWAQQRCISFNMPAYAGRGPAATRDRRDAAHFVDLLDDAIRRRVPDEAKLAIALSGGLDSTSLASSVRAVRPTTKLTAVCIGVDTPEGDERATQREIAAQVRADVQWASLGLSGPFGESPGEVFRHYAAPSQVSNWFIGEALAATAEAAGASLVMDGEDGDALLSGNPGFLSDLIARGRWLRWRREAAAIARIWGVPPRRTLHRAVAPLIPLPLRRAWWQPGSLPSYIHPELASLVGLPKSPRADMAWRPGREFASVDSTFRDDEGLTALGFDTTAWFIERDLTVIRPLLDRRLIEYCGSLPWDQKVREGASKVILRRSMHGRLPPSLLGRTDKANLSSIFRDAVCGPQRNWVVSGFDAAHAYTADIFSAAGLEELRVKFEQGSDVVTPARVALLAHWLKWLETGGPRSFSNQT